MEKSQIAHDNHFVPRFYLKNWSADGKRIWGYRLLVSEVRIPYWKEYYIDKVAYHRDLYTIVKDGQESDDFEEYLEKKIEVPAQKSLNKVKNNEKLNPQDWMRLVYFLAAQDLRTPSNYINSKNRWEKTLPTTLQNSLEKSVQNLQKAKENHFAKSEKVNSKYDVFDDLIQSAIVEKDGKKYIKAEMAIGRNLWVAYQKYHLTNNVKALLSHKWSIIKPFEGLTWPTSDHPVVKLEYYQVGKYSLKGGWGKPKTDIFMPLSPNHLLFTEIGEDTSDYGTFSFDMTNRLTIFILENVFRFIFSKYKNLMIPSLRQRYVSAEEFQNEVDQWKKWHSNQSQSEEKYN